MLDDGRAVFVKSGPASEVLLSEAAGLRWLGEVAQVPEVIEAEPDRLVLAWVREERPTPEAAERFGRTLARMHRAGAQKFGAPWPGFIAELPMDNAAAPDWPAFYGERRVLPFLRQARLPASDVALVERAVERLPEVAGPAEPPRGSTGICGAGTCCGPAGRAC